MNDAILNIIIKAKNQASGALSEVEGSVKGISKNLGNSLRDAASGSKAVALGLVGIGTAAAGVVGFGSSIAGDFEAARQGFVTLLGSAEKADAVMSRIKDEARKTPFELPGLTAATQALALVTKDGSKSVDILLDVGKALSAAGKGQPELDRIIANLQQIGLTGKVTEMDIRQFGMNGINILELIADQYGITTEAAAKMQDDGKITFDVLTAALKKAGGEGGKFEKAFTNQAGTFNQLFSNMKDNIKIFLADFVKATGAFDFVKGAMARFNAFFESNKDTIINAARQLFDFLKNNGTIVAGVIIGALVPALVAAATALWAMFAPLLPFIAAGAAIGFLLQELSVHFGGWSNMINVVKDALVGLWNVIGPIILPALSSLWGAVQTLWGELKRLWDLVSPVLIPVLKVLGVLLGATLVASTWLTINVLKVAISIITGVINVLSNLIQWVKNVANWFVSAFTTVKNAISSAADWIGDKVNTIINFFKSIPSRIGGALAGVAEPITAPFRSAFNAIARLWNNTVGKISFTVPDWVPGIGGKGWSVPKIPMLAEGGIINRPTLAMIGEGREPEAVLPLSKLSQMLGREGSNNIGGGSTIQQTFMQPIQLSTKEAVDQFFKLGNVDQVLVSRGIAPLGSTGAR